MLSVEPHEWNSRSLIYARHFHFPFWLSSHYCRWALPIVAKLVSECCAPVSANGQSRGAHEEEFIPTTAMLDDVTREWLRLKRRSRQEPPKGLMRSLNRAQESRVLAICFHRLFRDDDRRFFPFTSSIYCLFTALELSKLNGPFVRLIIRNCSITHQVLNFACWHFLLRQIDESKAKQESGEKKVEHVLGPSGRRWWCDHRRCNGN